MSTMSLRLIQERRNVSAALEELSALCEEAGYDVPVGTRSDDLCAFVERQILGSQMDEKFGQKVRVAFNKVAGAFKRKKPGQQHTPGRAKPAMWTPGKSRSIAAR